MDSCANPGPYTRVEWLGVVLAHDGSLTIPGWITFFGVGPAIAVCVCLGVMYWWDRIYT